MPCSASEVQWSPKAYVFVREFNTLEAKKSERPVASMLRCGSMHIISGGHAHINVLNVIVACLDVHHILMLSKVCSGGEHQFQNSDMSDNP